MVEEADSTVCTYARIATTDTQVPTPLTDYWREPSSSFIISGRAPALNNPSRPWPPPPCPAPHGSLLPPCAAPWHPLAILCCFQVSLQSTVY